MKTTKRHFELYQTECRSLLDRLGLHDWEIAFAHEGSSREDDYLACCRADYEGMSATLVLALDWGDDKATDDEIRRVAEHEVLEVMTSEVRALAESREFSRQRTDAAVHALIHRIQRLLHGG